MSQISGTVWSGQKPKHVMDIGVENKNIKRRFVFWEGLGEYKIDTKKMLRNQEKYKI